jgi:hypothetical protein
MRGMLCLVLMRWMWHPKTPERLGGVTKYA